MLVLEAGLDRLVRSDGIERFRRRVPQAKYRVFDAAYHDLFDETDDIRQEGSGFVAVTLSRICIVVGRGCSFVLPGNVMARWAGVDPTLSTMVLPKILPCLAHLGTTDSQQLASVRKLSLARAMVNARTL